MNTAQHSKYLRCWIRCAGVNNWKMKKGRLVENAAKADASQFHALVWAAAEALAMQQIRSVAADDLRHACHIVAIGHDKSSKDFSSAEFDRLLLLWGNERDIKGLLIYPDDLRAHLYWDNPDRSRKESLIRSIKAAASDEYICSITRDVWGTIHWEDLGFNDLLGLLRKIKGNAPAAAGQPY